MEEGSQEGIGELRRYIDEWTNDLELLRQNQLLDESSFIRFSRDRGIAVFGVVEGDPGEFNTRGWLPHDGLRENEKPLFHPFRLYPLYRILEACRLPIGASSSLNREDLSDFIARVADQVMLSVDQIGAAAPAWNRTVELAILLDPVYWPVLTGRYTHSAFISEGDYEAHLDRYREKVLGLVRTLDPGEWRRLHKELRIQAARMDDNGALYLLLRVSKWDRREKLKGHVAGALWIRHIAEIVRRAFEEAQKENWPEEDEAFGSWSYRGRTVAYGSERPLDHTLESGPHLAFHFGLFTGSVVRWYVEGDTEYYAILSVLADPSKAGIELVNLRGNLKTERGNIALKLGDGLAEDRSLRRFSMISFDMDVAANVKAIRKHMEQEDIVGYIAAHRPDFEFANFALDELVEIAARLDESHEFSGDAVRGGDWTDVTCARDFKERYSRLSARRPVSFKAEEWGRALGTYVIEHPRGLNDQGERPFWREIRAALQCRIAHYDYQKDHFRFDPDTFAAVDRRL